MFLQAGDPQGVIAAIVTRSTSRTGWTRPCVGARGIFSTAACVIPREMAAIYKAYCDRDHETAFLSHLRAQPLNQYFEYDPGYVAPCKEALAMLGLEAGRVRKPLPELTGEERTGIRGALKDLGYQVRKT
jgi:dihydrodipicolinate synthase/N-acetylneuraminate lyase